MQQSGSVIHLYKDRYIGICAHIFIHRIGAEYIYIYIIYTYLLFARFFSIISYYQALRILPYALQQVLDGSLVDT